VRDILTHTSPRERQWLALAALAFVVLATMNAGGYRFGASDQAFYVPAILWRLDPRLFPHDRDLIAPQAELLLLDEAAAAIVGATGMSLPALFLALYAFTGVILALAYHALARRLGADRWTGLAFVAAMALRHRITDTAVNTFEGYFHPRMLAFGLGCAALVTGLTNRPIRTAALIALALLVHPTTAVWFGIWLAIMGLWPLLHQASLARLARAAVVPAVALAVLSPVVAGGLWDRAILRMDARWDDVAAVKDYVFPTAWPVETWLIHAAVVALVVALHWRRQRAGRAVAGEDGLVAGCLGLVAIFLASLPLVAMRNALAIQLQISRVFWMAELLAVAFLVTEIGAWIRGWRGAGRVGGEGRAAWLTAALAAAALGRGVYVMTVEHPERPVIEIGVAADAAWEGVLHWAGRTPVDTHFLADPGHAWKYGVSLRAGAARDVYLEEVKDTAMALYSREAAMRVLERIDRLGQFDALTPASARRLADIYDLDYLVSERTLGLPEVWRNDRFRIYRLRP
jgi:hypothetical protein